MAGRTILAVNGGSSSLKCALFAMAGDGLETLFVRNLANERGTVDGLSACLDEVLQQVERDDDLARLAAVGHRVVHGGDRFAEPALVTGSVLRDLQALVALAPLHQPANLQLIDCCAERLPGVPQVACFDTAFHRHMPDEARNYAIPRALTEAGIHAYGFHGISYSYILDELLRTDPEASGKRVIIAHLGAGASMCAVRDGKSVATTMGFSTIDGMPMATRSGSIDPGVLLHLMRTRGKSADELEHMLYKESGLAALSGISGDMRELSASSDPRARRAIDYFVYRAICEIGSLAAALGGLDVLVFTGGIGANDAAIRQDICRGCGWLGVRIDDAANVGKVDLISADASAVEVRTMPTNEELQIARQAARLLQQADVR